MLSFVDLIDKLANTWPIYSEQPLMQTINLERIDNFIPLQ